MHTDARAREDGAGLGKHLADTSKGGGEIGVKTLGRGRQLDREHPFGLQLSPLDAQIHGPSVLSNAIEPST